MNTCPVCSKEFEAKADIHIYCSETCSKKAKKRRKAGASIANSFIDVKCPYCGITAKRTSKIGGGRAPITCGSKDCTRKHKLYCKSIVNLRYRDERKAGTRDIWPSSIPKYNLEDKLEQREIYRLIKRERAPTKPIQSFWDKHVGVCAICGNKFFMYNKKRYCSDRCMWKKCGENRNKTLSWRISKNISGRFSHYIRGLRPAYKSKWNDILDYSFDTLKAHLEAQFEYGMTWDNYGSAWHIDHIYPISRFDWSNQLKAMSSAYELRNLMPRWKTTKIAKQYGSKQIGNINKRDSLCLTA